MLSHCTAHKVASRVIMIDFVVHLFFNHNPIVLWYSCWMFVNANGVRYYWRRRRRHSDIVSADNERSVYICVKTCTTHVLFVTTAYTHRHTDTHRHIHRHTHTHAHTHTDTQTHTHTRRRLVPRWGAAHTMNMCPTDAQTLFPEWQVLLGRRYSFYFFFPRHQTTTRFIQCLRPETNHEKKLYP